MKPYRVFLRIEAIETLRGIRGTQRTRIVRFVESLSADPFRAGDYFERDETQRQIEITVIGQHAITFWSDHAVSEVKVIDIRRADRP